MRRWCVQTTKDEVPVDEIRLAECAAGVSSLANVSLTLPVTKWIVRTAPDTGGEGESERAERGLNVTFLYFRCVFDGSTSHVTLVVG